MSNQSDENAPTLGSIVFGPNNGTSDSDKLMKEVVKKAEEIRLEELNKLVKPLQDKLDRALAALHEIAAHGCAHELSPDGHTHRNCGHFTLAGFSGGKSGFHEYIREMDQWVRDVAIQALEDVGEWGRQEEA